MQLLDIKDFPKIYDIMEKSFPEDEYRNYEKQKELLTKTHYKIYVHQNDHNEITSFIAVWNFKDFAYIEHLAVDPYYRNKGIGSQLLTKFCISTDKPICLEVEPPNDEISQKRIQFYQRHGFHFNHYPYIQPPMTPSKKPIPLFIMTSHSQIDDNQYQTIKSILYKEVYGCYKKDLSLK